MVNLHKTKELLDDSRDIGFGYKVDDLKNMDYNDAIKFFRERIEAFYIEPGQFLLKKIKPRIPFLMEKKKRKASNFGFLLIVLSSILIDTLSRYRYGDAGIRILYFEKFLKKYIPEFDSGFSKSGVLYLQDDMTKTPKNASNIDYAEVFYRGFRCGIIHSGKILSYGGYVYNQKKFLDEDQWTDSTNTRVILSINPVTLFNKVVEAFEKYVHELKQNRHISKFFKKFELDFGYTLFFLPTIKF